MLHTLLRQMGNCTETKVSCGHRCPHAYADLWCRPCCPTLALFLPAYVQLGTSTKCCCLRALLLLIRKETTPPGLSCCCCRRRKGH